METSYTGNLVPQIEENRSSYLEVPRRNSKTNEKCI